MKKVFNYLYTILLAAMVMVSCSDFLDINTDPTRLKSASITQVTTAAESSLAFNMGSDVFLYSSIFSQQAAGQGVTNSQTRVYDQYILTNTDVNNAFTNFYAGTLADLNYIRANAFQQSNPQHAGMAKVMQAYTFGILTDLWGDVPYKEAMKGVANVQPHYDGSNEIYDSLFVLIDDGIANIGQANFLKVGAEDLIYGGDMTKWIKFANTLKLRLALHYAMVDNGTKLKEVIAAGNFMTSNADNFQLTFENVVSRQNPIHQFEISRADYYATSDFMVTMMNTKSDPRRSTYFTSFPYSTTGSAYKGTVPGDATSTPYSRIHTYLRGSVVSDNNVRTSNGGLTSTSLTYTGAAPIRMLSFAEYNFIRAEAALVYGAGTPADAATFFKAGIDASLDNAGITGASASTYSAAQTSGTLTLQKLIEEKYVANYGVAAEPWTDWRRTGFPTISVSPAASAQGNNIIPRILIYPLSEQQANLGNLPERQSMVVKSVFWDK
jgi:hypothetical protein